MKYALYTKILVVAFNLLGSAYFTVVQSKMFWPNSAVFPKSVL